MTSPDNGFKNIAKVFFLIWLIIWLNFIARDLFRKGYLADYKILALRDEEGKRSYTYGDYLFEFLKFCKFELPSSADYDIVGIEENSLDARRAIYYLYPHPHIKRGDALFLLVFNSSGFNRRGYLLYKKLDSSRYILKRV